MKASFRFAGGREFARMLGRLPERTSRTVQRQALRAAAAPMEDTMVRLAPHAPGEPDLRDTITVSNTRGGDLLFDDDVAIAVGPSKEGYYGIFQEFGTVHHGAQPFARPAFDQNVMQSLRILADELWKALAKRRGPVTGIRTSERTL